MSDNTIDRTLEIRTESTDSRRRQLRNLLVSAADTARQTRRVHSIAARVGPRMGRAIRDRVSKLLSAAG